VRESGRLGEAIHPRGGSYGRTAIADVVITQRSFSEERVERCGTWPAVAPSVGYPNLAEDRPAGTSFVPQRILIDGAEPTIRRRELVAVLGRSDFVIAMRLDGWLRDVRLKGASSIGKGGSESKRDNARQCQRSSLATGGRYVRVEPRRH
jgi:hypothetical protein